MNEEDAAPDGAQGLPATDRAELLPLCTFSLPPSHIAAKNEMR
jgi:hypothetical protein